MEIFPQIEIDKYDDHKSAQNKKIVILFMFAFMLCNGIATSALESESYFLSILDALRGPVFIVASMGWCAIDYMHREGKTMHVGWFVGFFIFAPIALPAYLLKFNGMKKGGVLVFKAILIFVFATFFYVVGDVGTQMLINT